MHLLSFQLGLRAGERSEDGHWSKKERKYYDFIVSGQPLSAYFGLPKTDRIGILANWENRKYSLEKLAELTGEKPSEQQSGRFLLYVCAECGSVDCGAATTEIIFEKDRVIWQHFAYETDYQEPDFDDYTQLGPYIFERQQYMETMALLKTLLRFDF